MKKLTAACLILFTLALLTACKSENQVTPSTKETSSSSSVRGKNTATVTYKGDYETRILTFKNNKLIKEKLVRHLLYNSDSMQRKMSKSEVIKIANENKEQLEKIPGVTYSSNVGEKDWETISEFDFEKIKDSDLSGIGWLTSSQPGMSESETDELYKGFTKS